ncbi:MAG: hypothetical protein JWM81_126 [Candidatus Saccharibacteria bacterium]|nr:hypothetical protein [Candidatus Saccharibacteria bacterium]
MTTPDNLQAYLTGQQVNLENSRALHAFEDELVAMILPSELPPNYYEKKERVDPWLTREQTLEAVRPKTFNGQFKNIGVTALAAPYEAFALQYATIVSQSGLRDPEWLPTHVIGYSLTAEMPTSSRVGAGMVATRVWIYQRYLQNGTPKTAEHNRKIAKPEYMSEPSEAAPASRYVSGLHRQSTLNVFGIHN